MIIQADYKKKEATITVTLEELGMLEDIADNWLMDGMSDERTNDCAERLERHCRTIRLIYEGKE